MFWPILWHLAQFKVVGMVPSRPNHRGASGFRCCGGSRQLTASIAVDLESLAPFGAGNPQPRIAVVGGLVAVPVIAVPTSIGYGASLGGVAALLGMLNSCASNVLVVNIDNGFGAGFAASLINRL